MDVPWWVWTGAAACFVVLVAAEVVFVERKPGGFTIRDAAIWVSGSIALAVVLGIGIGAHWGGVYASEFFTVYLTEYSLSVDNLFLFMLILSAFAVPSANQHRALMAGVLLSLVLRVTAICLGTAVFSMCQEILCPFGLFLLYTAGKLVMTNDTGDNEIEHNRALRLARKKLPITSGYHGTKLFVRAGGKIWVTPMVVVMVAIGSTDVLFATDSLPAVFGLTRQPFLMLAATALALMGLRHLYFLLGGLLRQVRYLSTSLSVILGFIGIKLILESLHDNTIPFINNGKGLPVPTFDTTVTLGVIGGTLAVGMLASMFSARRHNPRRSQEHAADGSGAFSL
jgi:tellurite resistance protein TerC